MISYFLFLEELESLALRNNLRLCISRASVGCFWIFYFRDDKSNNNSKAITFDPKREEVHDLEIQLQQLANEFNEKLGYKIWRNNND